MKKLIITENQLKMVIKNILNEQNDNVTFNKVVQCFLNKIYNVNLKVDGIIGEKTKNAVMKFQSNKGMYPVDGVFGGETRSKMTKQEQVLWKQCTKQHGGLIDRLIGV